MKSLFNNYHIIHCRHPHVIYELGTDIRVADCSF